MENVDYKRELEGLYRQSESEVSLVDVPPLDFLRIDGEGDPGSRAFAEAIEHLYPFSYGIRAIVKAQQERKYVVMPLEGLWWAADMDAFERGDRDEWQWTLMIMQPEFVTEAIVEEARESVRQKRDLPRLSSVRFEAYDEGMAVQTLHVGPFTAEGPTVERVHEFAEENGYALRGKHHEIYLSDMRRTDPERLRTIVRQPIER